MVSYRDASEASYSVEEGVAKRLTWVDVRGVERGAEAG